MLWAHRDFLQAIFSPHVVIGSISTPSFSMCTSHRTTHRSRILMNINTNENQISEVTEQLLQSPSFSFPQGCWQRLLKSYPIPRLSPPGPETALTNKQDFKPEELVAPWCRSGSQKSTKLLFALCGCSNGRMKTTVLKLRQSANLPRDESWELWHWCLKKKKRRREAGRERCRGLPEKCLQDRALTHHRKSKTKNTGGGKAEGSLWSPTLLSQQWEGGCVWLVHGESQARVRSMCALNADQSYQLPSASASLSEQPFPTSTRVNSITSNATRKLCGKWRSEDNI